MKIQHPIKITNDHYTQHVHEYFAWMRQEAPVCKIKFSMVKDAYVLARYEDVAAATKDPRIIKNPNNVKTDKGRSGMFWMPKAFRPLLSNMLNSDEPDHRRLRNLVHKAFTPKMIAQMDGSVRRISAELLDNAAKLDGPFDLIEHYALPLPVTVIADLIGIDEVDRPNFFKWASTIVVQPTPLNMVKAIPAITSFVKYTRKLARQRSAEPRNDLMTALVQAEEEGDTFTEDELAGMVFLLLVAGHETTVNLIANGMLALLQHPDQHNLLKSDISLMGSAVEEFLRYDGPLHTTEASFAKEDITLYGVTIPKGVMVLPSIMSANRDETVFENANELDITRGPNKHLAFGHGIHYCLGAPLARLEAKIAFCDLIERFPNMRLGVSAEKIRYQNIFFLRRLNELPVIV